MKLSLGQITTIIAVCSSFSSAKHLLFYTAHNLAISEDAHQSEGTHVSMLTSIPQPSLTRYPGGDARLGVARQSFLLLFIPIF